MHADRQPLSANLVVDSSNPRARGTGVKGALGAVVKQHILPWAGAGGDSRSATPAPSTYRLALDACTRVQQGWYMRIAEISFSKNPLALLAHRSHTFRNIKARDVCQKYLICLFQTSRTPVNGTHHAS